MHWFCIMGIKTCKRLFFSKKFVKLDALFEYFFGCTILCITNKCYRLDRLTGTDYGCYVCKGWARNIFGYQSPHIRFHSVRKIRLDLVLDRETAFILYGLHEDLISCLFTGSKCTGTEGNSIFMAAGVK